MFDPQYGDPRTWQRVPCGKCIGCRKAKAREWALRCTHEATLHEESHFLTLTYDDRHLPGGEPGTLCPADLKYFFKDYRNHLDRNEAGTKIRYFACGEYGENRDLRTLDTLGRPHYHVLIFGHRPRDLEQETGGDSPLYSSDLIKRLWPYGHHSIGDVTPESAAYCAQYSLKKIDGDHQDEHYAAPDHFGETYQRQREFLRVSRGGASRTGPQGIGAGWLEKFESDCYKGFVTIKGSKYPIPHYYLDVLEERNPEVYEKLREQRQQAVDHDSYDNSRSRLQQRLTLAEYQANKTRKGTFDYDSQNVRDPRPEERTLLPTSASQH